VAAFRSSEYATGRPLFRPPHGIIHFWNRAATTLTEGEIMRRAATSKPTVWRWQERYLGEGVDGLRRDKTRPSRTESKKLL